MISLEILDNKFYIRGDIDSLKSDDIFNPTYYQLVDTTLFGFFQENDYLLSFIDLISAFKNFICLVF